MSLKKKKETHKQKKEIQQKSNTYCCFRSGSLMPLYGQHPFMALEEQLWRAANTAAMACRPPLPTAGSGRTVVHTPHFGAEVLGAH